jgi:DNA processing protein
LNLSETERRAWLRPSRTENVGPVTFRNLIARFGTAPAALEELPRMASQTSRTDFAPWTRRRR